MTKLFRMLNVPVCRFYDFIDYIEQTTFGIACDAQANFKVALGSFGRLMLDLRLTCVLYGARKHSLDTNLWSPSI